MDVPTAGAEVSDVRAPGAEHAVRCRGLQAGGMVAGAFRAGATRWERHGTDLGGSFAKSFVLSGITQERKAIHMHPGCRLWRWFTAHLHMVRHSSCKLLHFDFFCLSEVLSKWLNGHSHSDYDFNVFARQHKGQCSCGWVFCKDSAKLSCPRQLPSSGSEFTRSETTNLFVDLKAGDGH